MYAPRNVNLTDVISSSPGVAPGPLPTESYGTLHAGLLNFAVSWSEMPVFGCRYKQQILAVYHMSGNFELQARIAMTYQGYCAMSDL